MQRVHRILQSFDDYDNLVQELVYELNDSILAAVYQGRLNKHRLKIDELSTELRRHGCRREQ